MIAYISNKTTVPILLRIALVNESFPLFNSICVEIFFFGKIGDLIGELFFVNLNGEICLTSKKY